MGLGIFEVKGRHVPGTVTVDDVVAHVEDTTGNLKHGTGRFLPRVLI